MMMIPRNVIKDLLCYRVPRQKLLILRLKVQGAKQSLNTKKEKSRIKIILV